MRVKRYVVEDMSKALPHIRADLGSDAVILNSKQVKRSGLMGRFRAPVWEILAAVDGAEPGVASTKDPEHKSNGKRPARKAMPKAAPERDGARPAAPVDDFGALRQEMRELRTAVTALSRRTAIGPVLQLPPLLQEMHQALLEQHLRPEVATQVILDVAETLSPQALADRKAVQSQLEWQLSRLLPVKDPNRSRRTRPRAVFVVGPTGVGKTTTLAKLAADYALRQGATVTLVAADTYRVAAVQQIETYGEILGVPVHVAYTPDDLAALVKRQQEDGIALVDTPGRSPYNAAGLDLLRSFLEAVPDKEVHLALSACTKGLDLDQAVSRFAQMPLDGLLFTKLDETEAVGPLFNVAHQVGLPLTYLTTGQQVPDDIEIARPDEIARWVLKRGQPCWRACA